jgi:hypothetical protein
MLIVVVAFDGHLWKFVGKHLKSNKNNNSIKYSKINNQSKKKQIEEKERKSKA